MKAKEFFEQKFAQKVQEDPALLSESGLKDKKVVVEIDGSTGGSWGIRFDAAGNVYFEGNAPSDSADCVIQMKEDTFEGMLAGKVNVPFAFMMRKIKVKGESSVAAKVGLALQKRFLS